MEIKVKNQGKVVKMTATSEAEKKWALKLIQKNVFYGNRNSIDHLFTQSSCNYIFIIHTLSNVLMIDLFTDYYIISNNTLDNVINFLSNLSRIICASI